MKLVKITSTFSAACVNVNNDGCYLILDIGLRLKRLFKQYTGTLTPTKGANTAILSLLLVDTILHMVAANSVR